MSRITRIIAGIAAAAAFSVALAGAAQAASMTEYSIASVGTDQRGTGYQVGDGRYQETENVIGDGN